jgi:hypothetical protein
MMLKKQFYQECGALITLKTTSASQSPEFRINPDYPYEDDLNMVLMSVK